MNHFQYGLASELMAIKYLNTQYDLVCLEHRYKNIYGEIDILMLHHVSETLVCVEVKAHRNLYYDKKENLVSIKQQKRCINSTLFYISNNVQYEKYSIRFDVVVIFQNYIREYIENAWLS